MMSMKKNKTGPKILIIDIETAPILAYVWGIFDQNVALNQIKSDWHILSFAAKWLDDSPSKIYYADQRNTKDIENDKKLLEKIWILLNEADIVIGQNVKQFDKKKINARFLLHGMKPPSSYRLIDTLSIARKNFALTSNKLEFMSGNLNKKYKKLLHKKFPGFSLWSECLKGNIDAWNEMEKYNKYDILSTEELYKILAPWDNSINFDVYHEQLNHKCSCGSQDLKLNGYAYTSVGKFQRYVCKVCGRESRGRENLLGKEKRKSLNR